MAVLALVLFVLVGALLLAGSWHLALAFFIAINAVASFALFWVSPGIGPVVTFLTSLVVSAMLFASIAEALAHQPSSSVVPRLRLHRMTADAPLRLAVIVIVSALAYGLGYTYPFPDTSGDLSVIIYGLAAGGIFLILLWQDLFHLALGLLLLQLTLAYLTASRAGALYAEELAILSVAAIMVALSTTYRLSATVADAGAGKAAESGQTHPLSKEEG